jgi:hypothetical protein
MPGNFIETSPVSFNAAMRNTAVSSPSNLPTKTSPSSLARKIKKPSEQFDPLRYAPERAEDKQHRFALFGFGGGIHKCTGMNFANTEMIIITTLLLRKFELTLLTPEPGIERSLGASRPEKTMVRYRRLDQSVHGKDDGNRRLVQSIQRLKFG